MWVGNKGKINVDLTRRSCPPVPRLSHPGSMLFSAARRTKTTTTICSRASSELCHTCTVTKSNHWEHNGHKKQATLSLGSITVHFKKKRNCASYQETTFFHRHTFLSFLKKQKSMICAGYVKKICLEIVFIVANIFCMLCSH